MELIEKGKSPWLRHRGIVCEKAAGFLGETAIQEELQQLCQERSYLMTFWGSFSSGKSLLLNRLLGRDILPVGDRETTPMVMLMRWTDGPEMARITLKSEILRLPIEQVREIYQGNAAYADLISQVQYMEILLHHDLLESGLVLVDMPGSNTLLERHQEIAERMLIHSSQIIYVMAKTPTASDRVYIQKIREMGMDMTFVRTHCDEIKKMEETPEHARQQMEEMLTEILGQVPRLILLSGLPQAEEWQGGLRELEQLIRLCSADLCAASERATRGRVTALSEQLRIKLVQFHEGLCSLASEEDLEEDQKSLQRQQEELGAIRRRQQEDAGRIVKKMKAELLKALSDCRQQQYRRLEDEAAALTLKLCDQRAEMEQFCLAQMRQCAAQIEAVYSEQLDPLIEHVTSELNVDVSEAAGRCPRFPEIVMAQDGRMEAMKEELLGLKELLKEYGKSPWDAEGKSEESPLWDAEGESQEALRRFAKETARLQEELKQLGGYKPQYYLKNPEGLQPSQVFKALGEAVDLILLFYNPEEMPILLGSKGPVQAPQQPAPSGPMALPMEGLTMEKFIASLDATKDAAYLASKVTDGVSSSFSNSLNEFANRTMTAGPPRISQVLGRVGDVRQEAKTTGLTSTLSMTTAGFWAEQFGRLFDDKPYKAVDLEYEKKYYEKKKEIEKQIEDVCWKRNEKLKELKLRETKEEQLRSKERELRQRAALLEKNMELVKADIRREAEAEALHRWKEALNKTLREGYDQIDREMNQKYMNSLEPRLLIYMDSHGNKVREQLENKKAKYLLLLAGQEEKQRSIARCEELLGELEEGL